MTAVQRAIRPIRRFASLSRLEQRLLVRSVLLVQAITVALRFVPLVSLKRALSRQARKGPSGHAAAPGPDTIAWAVTAASRYVPGAACLSTSLALQVVLERYNYPSRLWIGIRRGSDGTLGGHAWVELDSASAAVVEGRSGFRPIVMLESYRTPTSSKPEATWPIDSGRIPT